MMGRTHALIGINSLWLLTLLPSDWVSSWGGMAGVAAFGSLLPDLDACESTTKHLALPGTSFKPFLLPARHIHYTSQHRGLLHSFVGWITITLIALPLALLESWELWVALSLGYGSHLMADAATKSGIMLQYPRTTRYHLLPQSSRITTVSQVEEIYFAFAAGAAMALLLRFGT